MPPSDLLNRIVTDPAIFGGKPSLKGHRLAVEHVLAMLAAGDTPADILAAYPGLTPDDVQACMLFAYRMVAHERVDIRPTGLAA